MLELETGGRIGHRTCWSGRGLCADGNNDPVRLSTEPWSQLEVVLFVFGCEVVEEWRCWDERNEMLFKCSLLSWNKTVETKRITENISLFRVFLNNLKIITLLRTTSLFLEKEVEIRNWSRIWRTLPSFFSSHDVAAAGIFINFTLTTDDYFNDASKTVSNLRLIACKLEEVHLYLESFSSDTSSDDHCDDIGIMAASVMTTKLEVSETED